MEIEFGIVGEWWKKDILEIYNEALQTGGAPNISDAFSINGQPGDLYPCSKPGQTLVCVYIYIYIYIYIYMKLSLSFIFCTN
jgi:hypothetical protein